MSIIWGHYPESKMTFNQLGKWYLGQNSVKCLSSFNRAKGALKSFNDVFGDFQLNEIRQTDIEEYQLRRKKEGRAKDIPINCHVESVLKSLPRSILSDFVITYRGKPLKYKNSLKKQFSEVCKRAKIAYGRKAAGSIDRRKRTKEKSGQNLIKNIDGIKYFMETTQTLDFCYFSSNEA